MFAVVLLHHCLRRASQVPDAPISRWLGRTKHLLLRETSYYIYDIFVVSFLFSILLPIKIALIALIADFILLSIAHPLLRSFLHSRFIRTMDNPPLTPIHTLQLGTPS